jgi:hypothetical protein
LARHLHLKELDERPCMFQPGSAFDGWAAFLCHFQISLSLDSSFYKMDILRIISNLPFEAYHAWFKACSSIAGQGSNMVLTGW